MRVLTGSLLQESNTFSPLRGDLAFFRAGCLLFDEESLAQMRGTRTELGGFIAAAAQEGVDLLPTVAAWAPSAGPMDGADFTQLAGAFLDRVRGRQAVDGVLLALHGAWVSAMDDDADGYLLEEVRRAVGPDVPVVVTLDLHANVTARMARAADALVGYRTYPHVDMYETGERAARLLCRLLDRRTRARTTVCKVPLLLPPENARTGEGPLAAVVAGLRTLDEREGSGYLAGSVFPVQPWLDVAELGSSIVLVTERGERVGDMEIQARAEAARLGTLLWSLRGEFQVPLVSPREAVDRALASPEGPVLLVDSADGVSSGAPGDSTAVLEALLAAQPGRLALVTLVDPPAARAAARADGQAVALRAGGYFDPARHRPVELRGRARRVARDAVIFTAGVGDGLAVTLGAAAVVEVGMVHVLLMERPVPCYDPALYRGADLEPAEAQVVVVKSPANFRWTYRAIARSWIYVDAPGAASPRLASLAYTRAPRPLYPLDDVAWSATPESAGWQGGH